MLQAIFIDISPEEFHPMFESKNQNMYLKSIQLFKSVKMGYPGS